MQKKSSVLFRQDHLVCLSQTVKSLTRSYPGHGCKSWTNDSHGSQKQERRRLYGRLFWWKQTVLVIINTFSFDVCCSVVVTWIYQSECLTQWTWTEAFFVLFKTQYSLLDWMTTHSTTKGKTHNIRFGRYSHIT